METGEFRIFGFFLVVILAGVNAAIEVGEQLGDRFNTFVVLARRRVQRFRLLDIARFHCIGKGFGTANQLRGLGGNVGFIGGNGFTQAEQRIGFGGIFGRLAGHRQFAFRVGQQTAGHIIFARLQVGRQLLRKAGSDILPLFHHHHPFQNLPLQRFLAVVLNDELGFTRLHGDVHRLALFVGDGHFDLRNIGRLGVKSRAEQRSERKLQRITTKMIHHDHPFR